MHTERRSDLQEREGCCSVNVLVQRYAPGNIQYCKDVASLSPLWQPVKVYPNQTQFWGNKASHIYPPTPWLAPGSTKKVSSQMGYLAKGYTNPLLSGTHAHCVEVPARQRFHSHAYVWNGCMLSWWHWVTHLSTDIHIFCWLSREVSVMFSGCFVT